MQLYNQSTYSCSRVITRHFSTSFSLGIRTLHKRFHDPVYAIYGFVRYADEIVDSFHTYDKTLLLKEFSDDTFSAIRNGISLNPVLHAFQETVRKYRIPDEMIRAFLESMAMDLDQQRHSEQSYGRYIYGSAEVVGLMCLKVFCEGDEELYKRLEAPARRLGAAFQKVNFLRDMQDDYVERGRFYFPGMDLEKFDDVAKRKIEADIRKDFEAALAGILALPPGAKRGVYLAYVYYRSLFRKITRMPARAVMSRRVRIPDNRKILLLLGTWLNPGWSMK